MSTQTSSLSAGERELLARTPTKLLIGGTWRDGSAGDTFSVEDPATGAELARVADATAQDVAAALDAADAAQAGFAALAPKERSEILSRTAQLLLDHTDELALLMTLELG